MPPSSPTSSPIPFAAYVQRHAATMPELPLIHTTQCEHLPSIRANHALEPRQCRVFGEPLLYLFYGRPSYRDCAKTTPVNQDVAYCPVCFVLKPDSRLALTRVFPFDTGAFQKGHYEPQVPAGRTLNDFSVPGVIDSARQIVDAFFETNSNYLASKTRSGLTFTPNEPDAAAYYHLANGGGRQDCDDRRSTVEIQCTASANLRETLMAVVMPTHFLDDPQLRRTLLDDWRAHPLTYDVDQGMRPTEFHGIIRKLIRDYYHGWRFI
jgi:hypothetical protein